MRIAVFPHRPPAPAAGATPATAVWAAARRPVLRAGLGIALLPGLLATAAAAAATLPRCGDAFKRGVEYCSTDPARAVVELERAASCEPAADVGRRESLGLAGEVA